MNEKLSSAIPAAIVADLEEVARQVAAGGVLDAELLRRIHEPSAQVREELRRTHGERSVAVDLIRAGRDEE